MSVGNYFINKVAFGLKCYIFLVIIRRYLGIPIVRTKFYAIRMHTKEYDLLRHISKCLQDVMHSGDSNKEI